MKNTNKDFLVKNGFGKKQVIDLKILDIVHSQIIIIINQSITFFFKKNGLLGTMVFQKT